VAAGVFLSTSVPVATSLLNDAAIAYRDGVVAADRHATGHFTWHRISYLQTPVKYTFANGSEFAGGALSPLAWLLLIVAAALVGRLWRLPSVRRRRRSAASAV
jgi:hypothetical protein